MEHEYRKKMRRRETGIDVRFITFSCHQRLPLLGKPAIRHVFASALAHTRITHNLQLFAWVVMPEHVHLMMRPARNESLAAALRSLKTSVAKQVLSRWRLLRAPVLDRLRTDAGALRFWQKGGGFDRNVRDEAEFCREVRYIHRNPVERGLVTIPEDWACSSVRWWMGEREGPVPCDPPPGDPERWRTWRGYQ